MRVAMIRATVGHDTPEIFKTLLTLLSGVYRNASPPMKQMLTGMVLGVLEKDYGIDVRATWNRSTGVQREYRA